MTPCDWDRTFLVEQVGARYAAATLDSYECRHPGQQEAVGRIREFLGGRFSTRNVLLWGPCGTGKDHLLIGMLWHLVAELGAAPCKLSWEGDPPPRSIAYVTGYQIADLARRRIDDDDAARTFRRLCRVRILAMSDPVPPAGQLSPFQAAAVLELLDTRYRDRRPTWATMNVEGAADLAARLGAASADRLRHDAFTLHCDWPSYRTGRTA